MNRSFKYDMTTLIELVRNRPAIWDHTMDVFKDRTEKQRAWEEICVVLEKDFFTKDKTEQRRIGEQIHGKWQNVRDAFVKSLKKRSVHPTVRTYLYHEKLQFLMKVLQRDGEESSPHLHSTSDEAKAERTEESVSAKVDDACNIRKRLRLQEDMDQEILKALRSTKTAPDEDEAFFISITPTVQKMSEEDKLEFRMGVLQLIKDINRKGKDLADSAFFSTGNSSSSHPPTSFHHNPDSNADSDNFTQETHLFKCE
ncbi:uncharacterized protein LOC108917847 [Anoplophora glabripennis]|uniref:uncharacterized protein LOC108917847 n=1 Tax=Anoplophora glabripennis TaxID=217634 RepID=UPI000C7738F6|nr:uncharacterized protein LOC108917847 [Anoplophora glabripennis]